jgi:hypothetical protein
MTTTVEQQEICKRVGSAVVPVDPEMKVGIATATLGMLPLNALRHPPERGTTGWYIWGGDNLAENEDFFQPLHASHLAAHVPRLLPYLALAPGWRVLLAPDVEDLWYDHALLQLGSPRNEV